MVMHTALLLAAGLVATTVAVPIYQQLQLDHALNALEGSTSQSSKLRRTEAVNSNGDYSHYGFYGKYSDYSEYGPYVEAESEAAKHGMAAAHTETETETALGESMKRDRMHMQLPVAMEAKSDMLAERGDGMAFEAAIADEAVMYTGAAVQQRHIMHGAMAMAETDAAANGMVEANHMMAEDSETGMMEKSEQNEAAPKEAYAWYPSYIPYDNYGSYVAYLHGDSEAAKHGMAEGMYHASGNLDAQ